MFLIQQIFASLLQVKGLCKLILELVLLLHILIFVVVVRGKQYLNVFLSLSHLFDLLL